MLQTRALVCCLVTFAWINFDASAIVNATNSKPIIGILMQKRGNHLNKTEKQEYINSDYVKFIESAGGRVVAISNHITKDELLTLFNSINGVLFPGGDVPLIVSNYYHTARSIYHLAVEANDRNDYFPIWGTCLGFQTLLGLRVDTDGILSYSNADGLNLPLNFTDAAYSSRLFSKASKRLIRVLATKPLTFNEHQNCVTPEDFEMKKQLRNFFTILSTNRDKNGKEFLSSVEATDYPFYGVQWHPEKNSFDTSSMSDVKHTDDAITVTQSMANLLVHEARKSKHRFRSRKDELNHLIQNNCPNISFNDSDYKELYLF